MTNFMLVEEYCKICFVSNFVSITPANWGLNDGIKKISDFLKFWENTQIIPDIFIEN